MGLFAFVLPGASVAFAEFLSALFDHGRIRVPPWEAIAETDENRADAVLREFDAEFRREIPGRVVVLCLPAALWAARLMYRACQLAVYRNLGEEKIDEAFAPPCPTGRPGSVPYSVDLTLRFLPDLIRLCRTASPDDPLGRRLRALAAQWPLSSVGVPDLTPEPIDEIAETPCLMALYVDRILAARDAARLADPRAREAVAAALGLHAELVPGFLDPTESQPRDE